MVPTLWISFLMCLCALWNLSTAQNRLDLHEGDICKQSGGKSWICKPLKNCPKAIEDLGKKKRPQMCKFKPSYAVVCCEPSDNVIQTPAPAATNPSPSTTSGSTSRRPGIISKQMCERYGESVYVRVLLGSTYVRLDTCAVTEPLITLGKDAEPREYPHMALIGYGNKGSIQWLCGGSLISDRFVLSAAHCSDAGSSGPARWVRLGEYNVRSKEDEKLGLSKPLEYEIIQIINHPKYDKSKLYNDITLYKLDRQVEIDQFIRPICLNTDDQLYKDFAVATGWGKLGWGDVGSAILQKVNLTIFTKGNCASAYQAAATRPELSSGILDVSQFCAGSQVGGDTCPGDSGGPLQVRLKKPHCMYSQIGVTSFGGGRCGGNKPGVYSRVSNFVPWIESVVWP